MSNYCDTTCIALQVCLTCHRTKAPVGRSAPLEMWLCDDDCSGYREYPFPGHLWPGEAYQPRVVPLEPMWNWYPAPRVDGNRSIGS